MIKKRIYKLRYILIILSAILGLMWLSSSFWYSAQVWEFESIWDTETTTLKYWNFLSRAWGYSRELFVLSNQNYIFWTSSNFWGYPYFHYLHNYWSVIEWLTQSFSLCDNFTWFIESMPQNCNSYDFADWNIDLLRGYLKLVDNNSYWYAEHFWGDRISWAHFYYCVSTSSTRSVCLLNYWGGASLNLWSQSWAQVPAGYIWSSPWSPSWWGWSVENGWSLRRGDITNDMVIASYEAMGRSKAICYAWIWSWTTLVSAPWTWFDIFSIYNTYNPLWFENIISWYDYYREWFSNNRNLWSWSVFFYDWIFHMPHYSIFAMWSKHGVGFLYPSSDIIEYCSLKIATDNDSDYWKEPYEWELDDTETSIIYNIYNNANYYKTWQYYLQFSWTINDLSWQSFSWDTFDFFKQVAQRFNNGVWKLQGSVVWIIPEYILFFMFALILIRILRK